MSAPKNTDAELGAYFSTVGALRISKIFRIACGISAVARVLQEDSVPRESRDAFKELTKHNVVGLLRAFDDALSDYLLEKGESPAEDGGFDAYCGDPVRDWRV